MTGIIRNPHKFNINASMDGRYYNLWSTDNDRTEANDDLVIKSVYDPSPVGYSLPASNAFTGFTTTGGNTGNSSELNVKGDFDKGWHFYCKPNKQGGTIFFPASGSRHYNAGSLNYVTTLGICWLAGPYDRYNVRYLGFDSGGVHPLNSTHRSYGYSVRSAEEREIHKFNINTYMDGQYYNLWSTDNDRTDANDEVVIKSVYDPSPVGYSLPASNAFTGFTTTGNSTNNPAEYNFKGDFDKGWYFYTKQNKTGQILFFHASGYRAYNSGALDVFSRNGYYWTAGQSSITSGMLLFFTSSHVLPLYNFERYLGFNVRSAEEKCVGMVKIPDWRFVRLEVEA